MVQEQAYQEIVRELNTAGVTLVAVSKTKPVADMQQLYDLGQRDFGENYVQELTEKQPLLPPDIRWHFIGHLQTNKVKYIAPFVHMVHAVDSFRLLQEINKQAARSQRVIDVLLQVYIAKEESKFGLEEAELYELLKLYGESGDIFGNIRIRGLMGMASFSDNADVVRSEFRYLAGLFQNLKAAHFKDVHYFDCCSMGMSGDYQLAVAEGSNMVRIGSLLFGAR